MHESHIRHLYEMSERQLEQTIEGLASAVWHDIKDLTMPNKMKAIATALSAYLSGPEMASFRALPKPKQDSIIARAVQAAG